MMREYTRKLLTYILVKLGYDVYVLNVGPYAVKARELMEQFSKLQVSGEYKRHQVLARLKKLYPEAKTCDLAFVIELLYQRNYV